MTRIVATGRPIGSGTMADGNNTVAYSDNSGVTWSPALYNGDTTKNLFSTRGYDVLYNKDFNRWITVGYGSSHVIGYSYDGANYLTTNITWTNTQPIDLRSIACNGSRWIAVGQGTNSIAYSDDGFTWTGITGKTIFSDYGFGIDCVGTTWVAAGNSDSDTSAFVLAYSTDNGITWSDVSKNGGGNSRDIFSVGREVTSYGTLFVAGGKYNNSDAVNTLAYSYDGINWEGLGIGVLKSGVWRIATNGTRWVVFGDNDETTFKIAYSDTPTISSSWKEIIDNTFTSFGRGVCWAGGNIWIGVGATTPKIVRSTDNALTWTAVENDNKVFNLLGVGVNSNFTDELINNGTIALGKGTNNMAYSDDNGITWQKQNLDFFTEGNALGWNGSRLLAGGIGTSTLAYSNDGLNWTIVANSNNLFTEVRDFAYSPLYSRWVAVGKGNNSIAYSNNNGKTWTGVTNSTSIFSNTGYAVSWNGSRFLASGFGTNSLAYSNDGINWVTVTNSTSIFSVFSNGVVSNGTYWIAIGQGTNTIAYSLDNGLNWTGLGTSNMTAPAKISYNGNRLVIVGFGPTHSIIYSDNGTTWNNANNSSSVFTIGGNDIAWNDSRWVAVGSSNGGNSIAYSNDNGVNWVNIENSNSIFSLAGFAVTGYIYPPRPIEPEPIFNKSMPKKFSVSDGGNGFMLGRRAFSQNIHLSHQSSNLPSNNSAQGRISTSSGIVPKPLNNNSSDLRIQRLRLSTVGSSSLKVPDNTNISFKSVDPNFVNSARSRVRGSGGGGPKR